MGEQLSRRRPLTSSANDYKIALELLSASDLYKSLTMVGLNAVRESNLALQPSDNIKVAFFVGATSGLGLATLTEFVKHSPHSKVYMVGRSESKLSSIISDLKRVAPQSEVVPIKADIALFKDVDAVCEEFQRHERTLDLLVMSPGHFKVARWRMIEIL